MMNTTTLSSPSRCIKTPPVAHQQRCRLILQHCLAIQLCKPGHTPEDFWMYDSGYMIFQNFLAANAQCWWNTPLTAATRALKYAGHVAPGMLLVTAEPCALEVIRGAYARSVLKPPATYIINYVGDIDDCVVTPTAQGQFTPLNEALCDAIMDLTSQGQTATIENIKVKLTTRFTHMQQPTAEMIYDTLAQLMQERKIYQTARGYFIVTPERRRSRSRPRGNNRSLDNSYEDDCEQQGSRTMLLTNTEALNNLYGEITTERDGDLTHQCIQTNLADVICGGNPNDKIIYPRSSKRRSASFPTPRSLERRHSLRLFGSSKRLQRCSSTRSLTKNYAQTLTPDSSSSEYQSNESPSPKHNSQIEKGSLLSRLFRRSGRTKQRQIETYSAQFPPLEWFNSRTVHLHSIGTQTTDPEMPVQHILSNSTFYDGSEFSQRSSTLPRRHRRHMSSESTFVISSRDCSPIRRRSPGYYSGSLPRSTHSIPSSTIKTQRTHPNKQIIEEKNVLSAKSSEIFTKPETYVDNKILCDKERHYRNMQSGPSSLESGKASLLTSGPSSIDSGKAYMSKTSGHSSLDSQTSTNSIATIQSPARSLTKQSPKQNHYHQNQQQQQQNQHPYSQHHANTINKTKLTNDTVNRMKSASTQHHQQQQQQQQHQQQNQQQQHQQQNTSPSISFNDYKEKSITSSKSNNSITLQVTTTNNYQNNIPSTKIFVENSPIKSVITLENGKLLENSNVYIINNETTTNSNGDLINKKISTSKHCTPIRVGVSKQMESDCSIEEINVEDDNDDIINVEVNCDDNKLIIRNEDLISYENKKQDQQPDDKSILNDDAIKLKQIISKHVNQGTNIDNNLQMLKNNINNDNNNATMNNNRINKIQQQQTNNTTASTNNNNNNNIIYKNLLKLNDNNKEITDNNIICGSVGNLRTLNDKNLIKNKTIKSINDLKIFNEHQQQYQQQQHHQQYSQITDNLLKNKNFHILNSNPNIKDNEMAIENLLHKNIITVGSEPNLTIGKNYECNKYKIIEKDLVDRRFSLTKNTMQQQQQQQQQTLINNDNSSDLYNFPSLTDLSFNFTSITAQKLLQGVSRNSIDTLVELNMANTQDKPQNNNNSTVTNVCTTDYGMV